MSLGLQQNLALTQQLVMTPQLQQAIKLLQLSRLELASMIQQEMEENPALEEVPSEPPAELEFADTMPEEPKSDEGLKEVTIEEKVGNDIDWESYINEYNSTGRTHTERDVQEAPNYEAFTSARETLDDHLQWQLLMHGFTDEQQQIGSLIIGNLNIDGYLCASIEEIAETGGFSIEAVAEMLEKMQDFDPPGICARDLQETLLIQIRRLGIKEPLLENIIKGHIKNLENKNYKKIAAALDTKIDKVIYAVNIIKYLEPKPGRQFATDESHYIIPDIHVYKDGDDFKIVMNDDGLPKLKINRLYRDAVSNGKELSKEAKTYLNDKMQSASWLIKSIHQRQKTIYSVMESIIRFQREFFEKGVAYLKPMILKDVAEDINMHESTISRVTTNKYAYTPQGLFELKYFFNSSIQRTNGDSSMASESVKERIRILIDQEDQKNPLSDNTITEILAESNIKIARRTVAKYREMLHILPSSKRKQF
ncbi:RNA polymerase sigma-54 factor [Desulfamplus magnetovallimortis]|uniref:RNA polymerase sigma-54 factor n=1 Tax=Desulfamplus magnetovallimortis TaxID=1246637 RepID=A0A1W1H4M7_9BACT|nr:RNA polymerase factor sigma-54 [Desulfamplus magnetovallimortis]SLM27430.1 RNA polymerase sigma-54 factor [Desulfamplus magnetovallimortis]